METVKKKTKRNGPKKKTVLFVCTGNTCRSAMFQAIFCHFLRGKRKLSLFDVRSAGLAAEEGADLSPNAREALRLLGVPAKRHSARQITPELAEKSDLIVCMTAGHKQALSEYGDKVKTVGQLTGATDVPDPYGQSVAVYKSVAQYLIYACDDVLRRLQSQP